MQQPLPFTPTTPSEFARLMEMIWAIDCQPADDGGVTLRATTLYDEWHDAIKVARHCGLARTGGTQIGGKSAEVFRFPNGQGVRIASDGAAIEPQASRFGHKRAR